MNNAHVRRAKDLETTYEATRAGFLEYALRKSKESIPYIDKARALQSVVERETKSPKDLLKITRIREPLYESAGVSVKARSHLQIKDLDSILAEFIEKFLIPAGKSYVDELVYRYLLTAGDALGGRMRNLVGAIAGERFTRFMIAHLEIAKDDYYFYNKSSDKWLPRKKYTIDQVSEIRSIQWRGGKRQLIYNLNVPLVGKNIDLVVLNQKSDELSGDRFKKIINEPKYYIAIGELKGGIDPAGADEHWKTANTALHRAREAFQRQHIELPLFFIGAAIEQSMAEEIFEQYSRGRLANCANHTFDPQLASLCSWLVNL